MARGITRSGAAALVAGAVFLLTTIVPHDLIPVPFSAGYAHAAEKGGGKGGGNGGGNSGGGNGGGNSSNGGGGNSGSGGSGGGSKSSGAGKGASSSASSSASASSTAGGRASAPGQAKSGGLFGLFSRSTSGAISASAKASPASTKSSKGKTAELKASTVQQTSVGVQTVARLPKGKPQNIRAAMGALNAVNASVNAFANAAPSSRVGMIATYAAANVAAQVAAADLAEAQTALDGLNGNAEALRTEIVELEATVAAANETLAEAIAAAELESVDPTTDQGVLDAQEALAEVESDLADKTAELGILETEIDGAVDLVGDLQTAADTADVAETDALAAAANKEVTPEVKAEVDRILGEKGLLSVPEEEADVTDVSLDPSPDGGTETADTGSSSELLVSGQ